MRSLLAPALALAFGWGVWRRLPDPTGRFNAIATITLWAVMGTAALAMGLRFLGQNWVGPGLVVLGVAGIAAGLAAPRARRAVRLRADRWTVIAGLVVATQALIVAWRPVTGWDFRYIWGLKAKVLALGSRYAVTWLSWGPNGFHHSDYPPLWPDLLAAGVSLGGSVDGVAAVWQAVFVAGLAAACWQCAYKKGPAWGALGAAVGALAPIILAPAYSGYAEPLVAFLAAVAFGAIVLLARNDPRDTTALITACAAVACLSWAKNEGMVLAAGVVLASFVFGRWRDATLIAAVFAVAVVCWQTFGLLHDLPREPRNLLVSQWPHTAKEIARWIAMQPWLLVRTLVVAWVLVFLGLLRRCSAGVALAVTVWGLDVFAAYVTSLQGVVWHLSTSFDRVVAAPLPAAIAVALGAIATPNAAHATDLPIATRGEPRATAAGGTPQRRA